jgi:hypothetical protein
MKSFRFLLFVLLLPFTVSAQENKWTELFNSTFYSENVYISNRCNENVRRYLRLARDQGLNISNIEVIELLNKGFDNFGLVGARNARGNSEMDNSRNWYHHVFMKLGDVILDYDFTMKPTPMKVDSYFKSMYLTERMKKDNQSCLKDVGSYQITIFSGKDYLRYYDDKISSDLLNKKIFKLKDTKWACE